MLFHGRIREDGCERVGLVERPIINEAVMAGSTLYIDSKEYLSNILGCLHLDHLRRVDSSTPLYAINECCSISRWWIDQFACKRVVWFIFKEGVLEPFGEAVLIASMILSCITIAQGIIPEGNPVDHVVLLVGQKSLDQLVPVRGLLKVLELYRGGRETNDIQICPTEEGPVIYRLECRNLFGFQVRFKYSVNGVFQSLDGLWYLDNSRAKLCLGVAKSKVLFPW